jgi:hypothetical protein
MGKNGAKGYPFRSVYLSEDFKVKQKNRITAALLLFFEMKKPSFKKVFKKT